MHKLDIVFLFVIAAFIGYYICKRGSFDSFEGFAAIDDARQAVKEIYNADIDAIRNLATVATKLQAGGLTHPGRLTVNSGNDWLPIVATSNVEAHIGLRSNNNDGINNYLVNRGGHFRLHNHGIGDTFGVNRDGHLYNEHHGNHVAHHIGRGGDPYITLSRAGQWGNSSWYIQNLQNDKPENSSFRIGKHDVGSKLDIGSNGFLYSKGAQFNAIGDTHIPLIVQSNHDSHIQLTTKNDASKNVYLINRDGHFRVHHHGIGDRFEVNRNGLIVVDGVALRDTIPVVVNFSNPGRDHSYHDRTFPLNQKSVAMMLWPGDGNWGPRYNRLRVRLQSMGVEIEGSVRHIQDFRGYTQVSVSVPHGKLFKIWAWGTLLKKFGAGHHQLNLPEGPHMFWAGYAEYDNHVPDSYNFGANNGGW
jgi:hypothetical protein